MLAYAHPRGFHVLGSRLGDTRSPTFNGGNRKATEPKDRVLGRHVTQITFDMPSITGLREVLYYFARSAR